MKKVLIVHEGDALDLLGRLVKTEAFWPVLHPFFGAIMDAVCYHGPYLIVCANDSRKYLGEGMQVAKELRGAGITTPFLLVSCKDVPEAPSSIKEGNVSAFCIEPATISHEDVATRRFLVTVRRLLGE